MPSVDKAAFTDTPVTYLMADSFKVPPNLIQILHQLGVIKTDRGDIPITNSVQLVTSWLIYALRSLILKNPDYSEFVPEHPENNARFLQIQE